MKYNLKPDTSSVSINVRVITVSAVNGTYTRQFLLQSSNFTIKIEEGIVLFETIQFSLRTCTRISKNYIRLSMNIGHFAMPENSVMTSTEEVTYYADVGRKNKTRVIRFFHTFIVYDLQSLL